MLIPEVFRGIAWSLVRRAVLTGRITVHAEAVPSHVAYRLHGHRVALAAQTRLWGGHRDRRSETEEEEERYGEGGRL